MLSVSHELQILSTLRHPNIVQYYGSCVEGSFLNIFFEFVSGGSIASLLAKYGSFKEAVIKKYTKQIITGLGYLHANNILHRGAAPAPRASPARIRHLRYRPSRNNAQTLRRPTSWSAGTASSS